MQESKRACQIVERLFERCRIARRTSTACQAVHGQARRAGAGAAARASHALHAQYVSRPVPHSALKYIDMAIMVSITYKLVKPHLVAHPAGDFPTVASPKTTWSCGRTTRTSS